MFVTVLVALEDMRVKVVEAYDVTSPESSNIDKAKIRFDDLKKIYGGNSVCLASVEVK